MSSNLNHLAPNPITAATTSFNNTLVGSTGTITTSSSTASPWYTPWITTPGIITNPYNNGTV